MTELSENAKVTVLLADFAIADAANKVNILGANWLFTGLLPTGLTPTHSVVVFVEVPAKFYGESFALTITLLDEAGNPVQLPGQPEPLRVQQLAKADRPSMPMVHLPPDLPGRMQVILNFPNGMPLQPGRVYRWQVEIDANTQPHWSTSFCVPGPPPGPVIG